MGYEKIMYEEMDINIRSLIGHFIKNFHVIVIVMLIFSILVPGVVYIIDTKNYNEIAMGNQEGNKKTLTDEEKRGVETYLLLLNRKEEIENYYENSQIMKMDYRNVFLSDMQYYVEANELTKEDISTAIVNYINSPMFAKEFSENITNIKCDYVAEVVVASGSSEGNGVFKIKVLALNEDLCNEYANAVVNIVSKYDASLQSAMGEHKIKVIQNSITSGSQNAVYEQQMNCLGNLKIAISDVQSYEVTLNSAQKAAIANANVDIETQKENVEKPKFSIIYLVIGIIIGFICSIMYLYLQIICCRQVQTELELHKRFGISNLGMIFVGKESALKSFTNRLLYKDRVAQDQEQIKLICSRIELSLRNRNMKSIKIISSRNVSKSENLVRLCEALEERQIKCEVVGVILESEELCSQFDQEHNIILMETIGQSKIKDVYRTVQICKDANIDIVGYISTIE